GDRLTQRWIRDRVPISLAPLADPIPPGPVLARPLGFTLHAARPAPGPTADRAQADDRQRSQGRAGPTGETPEHRPVVRPSLRVSQGGPVGRGRLATLTHGHFATDHDKWPHAA